MPAKSSAIRIPVGVCALGLILAACSPEAAPLTPASQVTATEAPSQTSSPSATPTQRPTPTEIPFLSPTPEPLLVGPLVVMVDDIWDSTMYILDMTLGFTRPLHFEGGFLVVRARWIGNGCQLYVTLLDMSQPSDNSPYTANFKIVRTDLEGNVLEEIFEYPLFIEVSDEHDVRHTSTTISPTGDWFASIVMSHNFEAPDLDSKDVEVISTRHEDEHYVLTDGGDAAHIAWSPDGSRLAYSDRDADGVRQFYASNSDGTDKVQLTHFSESYPDFPDIPLTMSGLNLSDPVWSPNGQLLAFSHWLLDEDGGMPGSVWIVSASGDEQIHTVPGGWPTVPVWEWYGSIIGWSEDSSRLAFGIKMRAEGEDDRQGTIYWIDATDGSVLHIVGDSQMPWDHMPSVFPFGGIDTIATRAGSSWDLYLYDSLTGELEFVPVQNQPNIIGYEAIASPQNFPGEAACEAQADTQAP